MSPASSRLTYLLWLLRDNVQGMKVGRLVGEKVLAKAFSYFEKAYNQPGQGTSGKLDQDEGGDAARKGNLNVDGQQDRGQSLAAQVSQTVKGAAQQALS